MVQYAWNNNLQAKMAQVRTGPVFGRVGDGVYRDHYNSGSVMEIVTDSDLLSSLRLLEMVSEVKLTLHAFP